MRSFFKIKSSRIGEISIPFTDIGKSRPCREFLMSQICVLTLFAKIKSGENFGIYSIVTVQKLQIFNSLLQVST